jgi:DNA-binding NarL/FixJ family response regulator
VISVALIGDNRILREGITMLLNQVPDLTVAAAVASGDTSQLRPLRPRVILLDLSACYGDSLRVAAKVIDELAPAKLIVIDLPAVHEEIAEFVAAGVSGFITKDARVGDLTRAIRTVAEGAIVLPPQLTGTIFSRIARDAMARGRPEAIDAVRMTPREREVIDLIADGLSNEAISNRLHIATHTVRSHVRNVMEKLMLHTRLQIAAYAHRGEMSGLGYRDEPSDT